MSVGKIADIYANCGITKKVKATGLDALFDATIKEMKEAGDETIVFTNFVDFDSSWGHRRDVAGYAAGLELFDRRAGADGAGWRRRHSDPHRRPRL